MDLPDAVVVKTAIDGVKTGLELFRTAIGLTKEAKELVADGVQKDTISRSLDEAEKASRLAEAQIARALGYHLCQCTFPPQIMLSAGRHPRGIEVFKCPNCGKQEPSEQYFREMDEVDEYNRTGRDPDWITARY